MRQLVGTMIIGSAALAFGTGVQAQEAELLRDLESKSPHPLTVEETKALMPGARVSRLGKSGNTVYWTDEDNGTLFATSDNKSYGSTRTTTAHGKWNITEDGRYCVLIEYARVDPEQWCRFLIKTSDGYYGTTSTSNGASKVYKLDITK